MLRALCVVALAVLALSLPVTGLAEEGETIYLQGNDSAVYTIVARDADGKQYTYTGHLPGNFFAQGGQRTSVRLPSGRAEFIKVQAGNLSAAHNRHPDEGPNPVYRYGPSPWPNTYMLSYTGPGM